VRFSEGMHLLQLLVYSGLAIAALLHWRRRKSSAAGWLSVAFSVLAVFFISDHLWLEGTGDEARVLANVPIALLALFPYALYRFMASFIRPGRWVWLVAPILTVVVALPALALPDSEGMDGWVSLWVALLVIQWLLLAGLVVVRLWRAGRGQPSIARRRMRTMSLGAAGLVVAAVLEAEFSDSGFATVFVQLMPLIAAPMMLAGFAPPFPLRQWWRREEEEELRQVELSLVEADTAAEVAETLLENASQLLGGVGAVLETSRGEVVASIGSVADTEPSVESAELRPAVGSSTVRVDMRSHRLTVSVSPFTPFFGEEEVSRLHALTALADVALERNILFDDQRFLAGIVESSSDAILTKSLDGTITSWNHGAETMYGYRAEEVVGKPVSILLAPGVDDVTAILDKVRSGQSVAHYETKRVAKDGRSLSVALTVSPIRDRSGRVIGASTIARDVTEAARLQQELKLAQIEAERANSFKTEFLSRISHELRTPLNAILGFAQLLELDELTPDQRESIEQITKGGQRLLALINDILDISRIESGSIALSLEPVSVTTVVRDALALIKPLADDRGIQLRIEPTDDMHVLADQQRLGQTLLNLLSNAVKYNVDRGTVSVTPRAVGSDRIRIGVTDTGPGIAEEELSNLFTPFQRLGAEQTSVEGTGLGLSLSQGLVEAMGGTLEVDTGEGEGTTFWVELRAARQEALGASQPSTAADMPQQVSGKVLYIEDNLSNLKLIERLLEGRTEVSLISAMTGNLGLDLAQQHVPDLILLDLHLPDLQGDAVLARLRKDPRTAAIPVVMLSADATATQIQRLLAVGARDYLTKPINVSGFLRLLDRFLGRTQGANGHGEPTGPDGVGAES